MSKIRIFSLGGLNENGKNLYVVEVDKKIFVFDAGLKYDNEHNLGVDYIIPNYDYLVKNKKNIVGIFLTHGHESHIGALPDIVRAIPGLSVYGAKLTLDILKKDMSDEDLKKVKLVEIKPHVKINFGRLSVLPILFQIHYYTFYILKMERLFIRGTLFLIPLYLKNIKQILVN